MEDTQGTIEVQKKESEGAAFVAEWMKRIKNARGNEEEWRKKAAKIEKTIRGEDKTRFNIVFSNYETLLSSTYQRTPKPDVRRRFRDANVEARKVAEVLERALAFSIDTYSFDDNVRAAVADFLGGAGRGVLRVTYTYDEEEVTPEPVLSQVYDDETGEYVEDYVEQEPYSRITYQEVGCKYVHWRDFICPPASKWGDVDWIGFEHHMTREELVDKFGEKGRKVKLSYDVSGDDADEEAEEDSVFKRAQVFEVWDKSKRRVYFFAQGFDEILMDGEDPYNLQDFFPIPRPMYVLTNNHSLVPVSLHSIYESLSNELEVVTGRITALTKSLKMVGVYNKQFDELSGLLSSSDNTMLPVENFGDFSERGGLAGAVDFVPIERVVQVLDQLYKSRESIKQNIYEVTGISDIMRGVSAASETATAQRIKGAFGSSRINDMQLEVARFARDLLRLKAELIAEQYTEETLQMQTGQEVTPAMKEIMESDILREYAIDIETDSTVAGDEAAEQEAVTKLLSSVSAFAQSFAPLVQQGAVSPDAVKELLLVAVRRFKGVRNFEEILESVNFNGGGQVNGIPQGNGGLPALPAVGPETQGMAL